MLCQCDESDVCPSVFDPACWTSQALPPIVRLRCFATGPASHSGPTRTVLKTMFTWWNGATIGILFTIGRRGVLVGEDTGGNRYYEARDAKDSYDAHRRRWVVYNGYAEASK